MYWGRIVPSSEHSICYYSTTPNFDVLALVEIDHVTR